MSAHAGPNPPTGRGSLPPGAGQASLLMLAVVGALLAGVLALFAFGNALGAHGRHQRAADLAAVSAAQVMRELYPRLFEPPFLEPGVPNPRHLAEAEYLALARSAAVRGARRNGVRLGRVDVSFPSTLFAPTRVTVRIRRNVNVRVGEGRRRRVPVSASATAELTPDSGAAGMPGHGIPAAATTGRSRTARVSPCGPTWRSRSTAWPLPRATRRVST